MTEWDARLRCGGGPGTEEGDTDAGRELGGWREGPGMAGSGIWSESMAVVVLVGPSECKRCLVLLSQTDAYNLLLLSRRYIPCRSPPIITPINVRPVLQQHPHNLNTPICRRQVQRRASMISPSIDLRLLLT